MGHETAAKGNGEEPDISAVSKCFFEIARARDRDIRASVQALLTETYSGARDAVDLASTCLANFVILYMQIVSESTIRSFDNPCSFTRALREAAFSQYLFMVARILSDDEGADPADKLPGDTREILERLYLGETVRKAFLVAYARLHTLWAPLLNPLGAVMSLFWETPGVIGGQLKIAFHTGYMVYKEVLKERNGRMDNAVVGATDSIHISTGGHLDGFFSRFLGICET
ncbi:hypothetical protein BDW62DRAFT_204700 [Aspergillus aurantiobrunneus]